MLHVLDRVDRNRFRYKFPNKIHELYDFDQHASNGETVYIAINNDIGGYLLVKIVEKCRKESVG